MTDPEGTKQRAPVPSWTMDGIILDIRASLEALIVSREAMVAENQYHHSIGLGPLYREVDFMKIANNIRQIAKVLQLTGIVELSNIRMDEPTPDNPGVKYDHE